MNPEGQKKEVRLTNEGGIRHEPMLTGISSGRGKRECNGPFKCGQEVKLKSLKYWPYMKDLAGMISRSGLGFVKINHKRAGLLIHLRDQANANTAGRRRYKTDL